jgi:hypothetical protein
MLLVNIPVMWDMILYRLVQDADVFDELAASIFRFLDYLEI